jgi:xanthine dehydrogenase accessory factor
VCPEKAFVEGMHCYPSHCPSEGTVDIFLEPIANQQAVHLYGNTPIAQSIARYSEELSIDLKWRQSPEQLPQNISNSGVNIAIIATQGKGDFAALQQVLADKVEHVLLIASSKKALALKDKLKISGACANAIDKITAPAGIEIGANSGPEIALSVMAKVVSLRCNSSSEVSQTQQQFTENKAQEKTQEKTQAVDGVSAPKVPSNCCGGA